MTALPSDTVIATVRVLLEGDDPDAAVARCRRLAQLTGTEIRSVDLEPGWLFVRPRYTVALVRTTARTSGEALAAAFERAAQPITGAFGSTEPMVVSADGETAADLRFTDRWGLVAPGVELLLECRLDRAPAGAGGSDGWAPDPSADPFADWLAEQGITLTDFRRATAALKIVLLADVNGLDGVASLAAVRERLVGVPWEVGIDEPRMLADGLIRVACAVAMGEPGDTPQILFAEFARDLVPESWTVLESDPELLRAGWSAARPRVGIVRMQVLIAVHAVCWGETGWEIDESLADRPRSAALVTRQPDEPGDR